MSRKITSCRSKSPLRRFGLGLLLLLGLLLPSIATADEEFEENPPFIPFFPFQVSIAPNAQIMPRNVPIWGFALNAIYGIQHEVIGLDLGLFNEVENNFIGAGLGVVNIARGDAVGIHAGVGNAAEGGLTGLQLGGVNFAEKEFKGAQLGAGNTAENVTGAQIGIFNYAENLKGVQFGLINFNSDGPLWFMPFFNVGW